MAMRKPNEVLGAKSLDDVSKAIIFDGCSISQLGSIFDLDNREVSRRIRNLSPCGTRMSYSVYKLAEAAAYLVPAKGDIGEAIKKMSPKDLPPSLTKEYWAGQHARLKFEEDQGDLWRASDVVAMLAETFKTLRMSILLMQDQLERQTEVSDRQREILRTLIDSALNDLAERLIERFKNEPQREFDQDHGWTDADANQAEDEEL
jgi:hypothetical protein